MGEDAIKSASRELRVRLRNLAWRISTQRNFKVASEESLTSISLTSLTSLTSRESIAALSRNEPVAALDSRSSSHLGISLPRNDE